MRALGDSKTPLYFLVLTSAVNIVLDLVLIINFNMGVLGAAVATDVSQAISGVISLIYLIKKFKILHMTRDEWKYSCSTCRRLSAMGLPMGLQCTITAVGGVIMQWAVNGLGSSVVAAITAAAKPKICSPVRWKASAPLWQPMRARTLARPGWTVCAAV